MRSSQVLIFGSDSKLAALLAGLIVERERCPLLHPRDAGECLELLRRGWQSVLVLKVGRDVEEEMSLLAQVSALHPDTAAIEIDRTQPLDIQVGEIDIQHSPDVGQV